MLTYDWLTVISSAAFNNKSFDESNPICATGNCTFPVFSTLGFCSNCANITEFVQQNSDCKYMNNSLYDDQLFCTYRIPPSNLNRSSKSNRANIDMVNGSFNTTFRMAQNRSYIKNAPSFLAFALYVDTDQNLSEKTPTPEQQFKSFQAPFESEYRTSVPSSLGFFAFFKISPLTGTKHTAFVETADICALSFCGLEYKITVMDGGANEEITSISYSKLNYHGNPDLPSSFSSYNFTFPNDTRNFNFIPDTVKVGSLESGLQSSLDSILSGNCSFSLETLNNQSGVVLTSATSLFQQALNASEFISGTMDRIAFAMTYHLREINHTTVFGENITTQVFVHVSWFWLLLPISSVLSGALVLFSAIRKTKRNGLHVWKSSQLALLFHGRDIPLKDSNEMYKTSEMEAIAGDIQVKIGRREEKRLMMRKKAA